MVEQPLRWEFSLPLFLKDLGLFCILGRELLFYLLGSLCQGCGEHELPDVRMVFSQHSLKGSRVPLLSVDLGSKLQVVSFHSMEIA